MTYDIGEEEEGGEEKSEEREVVLEAIAICNYINKFFNPSSEVNPDKYIRSMKSHEKHQVIAGSIVLVAIVVGVGGAVANHVSPGSIQEIFKPGITLREAHLSKYSNTVTIEDAFENFFEKPKWSTYKDKGDSFVVFTGVCKIENERADIKISFKKTGEKFIVDSLEINGVESVLMVDSLLTKVYDSN